LKTLYFKIFLDRKGEKTLSWKERHRSGLSPDTCILLRVP